jgi:hypothetical protein
MKKAVGLLIVSVAMCCSTAYAVTISTAIPGTNLNSTSSSPGAFIANFYQFALIIAGVLAFGIVVYGGIRYMTSAGNPSGASEGKEWIEAALLGLLLLAGAYFILKVVNPQLLNLNLPSLTAATVAPTTGTGTNSASVCGGSTMGTCPDASTCNGLAGSYYCQANCYGGDQGSCPSGSGQTCKSFNYGPYVGYKCQ